MKGININAFILSYNFHDSYWNHVEAHSQDENVIKGLRVDISKLTIVCKDKEKMLQIYGDKEAKLKEEFVSLKVKLEKAKKAEEGMRKQYKVKVEEVDRLELEVVSFRK